MPKPTILSGISLCLLTLSMTGGCVSSSDPARFYLLNAEAIPTATDMSSITIGIGPAEIAPYLDRPQIVTRKSGNQLNLSEFDRWGEPITRNLVRVVAENVAALSGTRFVYRFPWPQDTRIHYQLLFEVNRFDADESGTVILEANWRIDKPDKQSGLPAIRSRYTAAAAPGDYPAMVAAMNRALLEFSSDVADAIRQDATAMAE